MRVVLHTGKGGVGKTTMSAATAIAAAGAGHRTLLLSTDPAHSVADVLGVQVGGEPGPVEGVANLWAAQVATRDRFEQAWSDIRGYLVGVLAARGMAEVQAEELTILPGADEIVALLEVHRHANDGQFDVIVVDCAPSGEALRLLALPETISFYGEKLMGTPARVMRTLAAGFAGLTGARGGRGAAGSVDEVADALGRLLENLTAARDLLTDTRVTGVRIVLTPERVVIAEARRLLTALALHGFAVEAVLVNRLLPEGAGSGPFLASWRAAQAASLPLIAESFGVVPVHRVTMTAEEPVGLARLGAIADELFSGADPIAHPVPAAGPRTEGVGGHYTLRIALPLVQRGAVDLTRSGDDLIVTVGQQRRRIALPSTLRRCRTVGATFDGDALVVEFEADLSRWPAALTGALTSGPVADDGLVAAV